MKKIVIKVLMLTVLLSVSVSSYAYDFEVDGIYYTIESLDDLTCRVTSGDNKYSGNIVIPSVVKYSNMKFTVDEIEGEAFRNSKVNSVKIPNSISSIGVNAFEGSFFLYVDIPNSVTYLGSGAFARTNIISIEIPSSIEEVPNSCFQDCKNLSEVKIADGIKRIGGWAFNGCISLKTIEIPNSVESIGFLEGSFTDCTNLEYVSLGSSVRAICPKCFFGCNNLKTIDVLNTEPPHLGGFLGGEVFQGVTYLEATLNIPKGTLEVYKASELWRNFKNINEVFEPEAGVAELIANNNIVVLTSDDNIIIKGANDAVQIDVYDVAGRLVYSGTDTKISVPTKGIHIVRVAGQTFKVAL